MPGPACSSRRGRRRDCCCPGRVRLRAPRASAGPTALRSGGRKTARTRSGAPARTACCADGQARALCGHATIATACP
ncbi:hypothetical protein G6F58_013247 [Rhizopus delemar]|nr:hypothetical protein G6F58_013247 [Rhizopus delemar]